MQYLWALYLWLPMCSSRFHQAGCEGTVLGFAVSSVFISVPGCCTLQTPRFVIGAHKTHRDACEEHVALKSSDVYFEGKLCCSMTRLLSAQKMRLYVEFLFEAMPQPHFLKLSSIKLDCVSVVLQWLSSWASIYILNSIWWLLTAWSFLYRAGSY